MQQTFNSSFMLTNKPSKVKNFPSSQPKVEYYINYTVTPSQNVSNINNSNPKILYMSRENIKKEVKGTPASSQLKQGANGYTS